MLAQVAQGRRELWFHRVGEEHVQPSFVQWRWLRDKGKLPDRVPALQQVHALKQGRNIPIICDRGLRPSAGAAIACHKHHRDDGQGKVSSKETGGVQREKIYLFIIWGYCFWWVRKN